MKSKNNFILYDREFTPSKDYIQVYITSSGNNYPEPIEFYVDNIKITDGTTEDVIDGGIGNKVAFKYRIHDASIGRFLSVDPLVYEFPHQSPYAAFNNNPNIFVDPDGRSGVSVHEYIKNLDGYRIKVSPANDKIIITRVQVTQSKVGKPTGFSPVTGKISYTVETTTMNLKGEIQSVTKTEAKATIKSFEGHARTTSYETLSSETVNRQDGQTNSDLSNDDLVNSFADFAKNNTEDVKEGAFPGLSAGQEIGQFVASFGGTLLSRLNNLAGAFVDLGVKLMQEFSDSEFHSDKIPLEEAPDLTRELKSSN